MKMKEERAEGAHAIGAKFNIWKTLESLNAHRNHHLDLTENNDKKKKRKLVREKRRSFKVKSFLLTMPRRWK